MLRATATRPNLADPALARRWQALAAGASAFLSWDWVGCLAEERYTDPVLIETWDGDACAGLALFNRRRSWRGTSLFLHESGDPALDSIYVEHNGVVAAPGQQAAVLAATLACAQTLASRVVLSGIDDAGLATVRQARGLVRLRQTSAAPFLPLEPGGTLLPLLSRNTRAQLRRSDRFYAAQGPITVERAATAEQALDWMDRLLALHVATWTGRGIDSGFARPPVQRFHQALLRRGVPSGLVDLLRITAGPAVIGFLMNLQAQGRVAVYQSGFDYGRAGPHGKPGLTCHAAAIGRAWAAGDTEYDFLAGDSRYKRSLATHSRDLHWLEWCRPASMAGAKAAARLLLRR